MSSHASSHAAPGQYLGYSLQPVRFCFHLLTAPDDASVSIELEDDVAVHFSDGAKILEQSKSALKHNALADWSTDLWKTLGIWTDGIEAGYIDPSATRFHLYVAPPQHGEIAEAIDAAKTSAEADSVLELIRGKLAKRKKPLKNQSDITRVISATKATSLIFNTSILSADSDPVQPLRQLLSPTVAPEILDEVCRAAIGFAKEQADKLLRNQQPAIINAGAFKAEFRNFVRKLNVPGLLRSLAHSPSNLAVESMLSAQPVFVRQLDIIELPHESKLRAISDFLHASAEKIKWSECGLIFEDDLLNWDQALQRKHAAVKSEIEDLHSEKSAVVRGRVLLARCDGSDIKMEGRDVPSHFVYGSFHRLADALIIGWHPDYLVKLQDNKAK